MGSKDTRRIIGPEKSTPIHVFQPLELNSFLNEDGLRQDKRSALDLRKVYLGMSNISQAKGSSFIELGGTKVVCGVYGPHECAPSSTFRPTGQVFSEVKFAPFSSVIRRSPLPDRQAKELSTQVKETLEAAIVLEQYPKSQIDVFITIVEEGGSLLSACVTAASLALSDARVHMFDIPVAASLVWYEGEMYLDPTITEEQLVLQSGEEESSALNAVAVNNGANSTVSNGSLTVALMPAYAKGQVPLLVQSGAVTEQHLQEGLNLALEACKKMYAIVKQVLLDALKKENNET